MFLLLLTCAASIKLSKQAKVTSLKKYLVLTPKYPHPGTYCENK